MKQYAPIALFTYARADHTQKAVESLLTNKEATESELFIFSDGPKNENKKAAVEENRKYIHTITGFKSIHIIEREKNWGLANSLIAGITDVISKYGRIIVVEDDLILSPYFLKFMNEALEKYKDEDKIGTISAFVPPIPEELPETFLLTYFQCWGWATWKRAWDLLEKDPKPLLRKLRFRKKKFDVGGYVGNYGNLYCQKVGLVDSWYIRYYASLFLQGKLSLYPGHSLTGNNGLDDSGTHCKSSAKEVFNVTCYNQPINLNDIKIQEDAQTFDAFKNYFKGKNGETPTYNRIKSFIRRLFYIDCM
ncbi:MAG: glycosyltransferase [Prevotella sp.]|nr:glycosyltransferase [Prevotella sp.]